MRFAGCAGANKDIAPRVLSAVAEQRRDLIEHRPATLTDRMEVAGERVFDAEANEF